MSKPPVMIEQRPWRIAILRALQLGDLLTAVPALRALRRRFPHAEITLIGLPWAREFVRRYGQYLDRFVEFAGYPGIDEVPFEEERVGRFLAEQRAYGYDIAIQMHGNGQSSNAFLLELAAPITVGYYAGETKPAGLTMGAPYPHGEPEIVRHLGLVAMLGYGDDFSPFKDVTMHVTTPEVGAQLTSPVGTPQPPGRLPTGLVNCAPTSGVNVAALISQKSSSLTQLEFPLFEEDYAEAATLLRRLPLADRPWIGLHPGSRSPARRWPVEYFATVADELARRFSAQILLTGSSGEKTTVEEVIRYMKMPAINLAGQTSLGGLAAILSKLDLFISNDTGPAHVADAIGCPGVTIFGPAEFERWSPLNTALRMALRQPVSCSPCSFWECPIDHRCLRWLSPARVIQAATYQLQQRMERTIKTVDACSGQRTAIPIARGGE